MKYATLLLGLVILIASITAVAAKVNRACLRELSKTFDVYGAKRLCDPKNFVKPNQLGWVCEYSNERGHYIIKGKGGARRKSDVTCE
jgi:hypothetical protein